MRTLLIVFIAIFQFTSCQEKQKLKTCNGIWKSVGHGRVLEIRDSTTVSFYDVTKLSCVPIRTFNFSELKAALVLSSDTLTLHEGPFICEYIKLNSLPTLCGNSLDHIRATDPIYNFEVFMETVKENYAFLELNNINWDELYTKQKGKLTQNSTHGELYLVIEETFDLLNDNHAFLNAPDAVYDEVDQLEIENEPELESEELGDFLVANSVAKHHLQEVLTEDSWLIHWGKMTDDIGYIQLKAMWLFADLDLPQSLIDSVGYVDAYGIVRTQMFEGNYMKKEIEGVRKIMNKIMNDLSNTQSLVIDVRFNGGGQDVVSLEILSHFSSRDIQFASQRFRYGDKHTPPNPLFLRSKETSYTKPVYVLTSPQTGSAAETFALATRSLPRVKRTGSSTEGAMSTTLDKRLPNGWDFCVSNEVMMDNDGKFYENRGVPVDYELNYSRDRQTFFRSVVKDLEKDKSDILNAINRIGIN